MLGEGEAMCGIAKRAGRTVAASVLVLLVAGAKAEDLKSAELARGVERSFRGEILAARVVSGSQPGNVSKGSAKSPDSVDLQGMARWSLRYLRNNADRAEHCRPYFLINLLPENGVALRPGPEPAIHHHPWDLGDVDLRMLRAMILAREMVGERDPDEVERERFEYALSFVRGNAVWTLGDLAGRPSEERLRSTWATARMVGLCAEKLKQGGGARWKALGERLVGGLAEDCVWREGAAWYRGILIDAEGKVAMGNPMGPSGWSEWVSEFGVAAESAPAQALAGALAHALATGAEPIASPQEFRPDGSYQGHVHFHVDCALGVLVTGMRSGNARYVEWAKRVYDYTKSIGTDTGWLPEWHVPGDHCDHGETCSTGGAGRDGSS
jgi:hypothetical protein